MNLKIFKNIQLEKPMWHAIAYHAFCCLHLGISHRSL